MKEFVILINAKMQTSIQSAHLDQTKKVKAIQLVLSAGKIMAMDTLKKNVWI